MCWTQVYVELLQLFPDKNICILAVVVVTCTIIGLLFYHAVILNVLEEMHFTRRQVCSLNSEGSNAMVFPL